MLNPECNVIFERPLSYFVGTSLVPMAGHKRRYFLLTHLENFLNILDFLFDNGSQGGVTNDGIP